MNRMQAFSSMMFFSVFSSFIFRLVYEFKVFMKDERYQNGTWTKIGQFCLSLKQEECLLVP